MHGRFRAHASDGRTRWSDEYDAFLGEPVRKLGVLAQEPIAGMDSLSATAFAHVDDGIDA
jgi:hypothetical protein